MIKAWIFDDLLATFCSTTSTLLKSILTGVRFCQPPMGKKRVPVVRVTYTPRHKTCRRFITSHKLDSAEKGHGEPRHVLLLLRLLHTQWYSLREMATLVLEQIPHAKPSQYSGFLSSQINSENLR